MVKRLLPQLSANKMAADLSRRGRRVPAGTGTHIPAALHRGTRLVSKRALRFTGGKVLFSKRTVFSRANGASCGCAAIRGDLRGMRTLQRCGKP